MSANLPASPQSNPSRAMSAPKWVNDPAKPVPALSTLPTTGTKVAPTPTASINAADISAISAPDSPFSPNIRLCYSYCCKSALLYPAKKSVSLASLVA